MSSPLPEAREERKLATVMLADRVASTAAADEEDPELTRALQTALTMSMAIEIERAGGTRRDTW